MGIYVGDSEIKGIYLGDTPVKEVYLGDTKIRPTISYQFVEWIASDGNQYIDTGVFPKPSVSNTASKISTELSLSMTAASNKVIFGDYSGTNSYSLVTNLNSKYLFYNGSRYSSAVTIPSGKTLIRTSSSGLEVNGVLYSFTAGTNFSVNNNITIFWTGYRNGNKSSFTLYSFKIWDDNVLVRDFVPCYRNPDGEIGLYDIVNSVFYTNSGTGTFTKGPDVN